MIRAAVICNALALLPAIATAQVCHPYEYATAFLKEHYSMQMYSWGMSRDGRSLELWVADDGYFATVITSANGCTDILMPEALHERLRRPPQRNRAIAPGPVDQGEPL